ncbi:Oxoglutarate/iron-dependent dioxygenase [Kalmanozyma brasiliensis GHG001]|uniref:Fe2OG dioxygenase domain-containing protein n=1 Tax=Kalmanozyma brasiliensis (strain GHG001) TaxID=1365824 RepID=V5EV58_KALBG|nr:Oxoglutarate/iron-dependent dioxygenase [Kalmanozyma brasiliensis GHG001]EST09340.1 Oxoglutarate/iron-dependent dioxygenase [Kalmanozyma brasiliensis GHG001]
MIRSLTPLLRPAVRTSIASTSASASRSTLPVRAYQTRAAPLAAVARPNVASRASPSLQPALSKRSLATQTTTPHFVIPVIDFSAFVRPDATDADRARTSHELTLAFKSSGFAYLSNHGISAQQIDSTFAKSAEFFELPINKKDELAWKDPRANRGYVAEGRERVTNATSAEEIAALREQTPDYKESLEIGNDHDPVWKNEWPAEGDVPHFKETMRAFQTAAHELHMKVMSSIAIGLGLNAQFFADKCNEEWHTLRLLHYPSVKTDKLKVEGSARAGEHSDYGSITLLFQDSVGGLEAKNPHTGVYHSADPIPGTIVVNVGDLLARWSNDQLRSTLHRVKAPQAVDAKAEYTPTRYSIAFFCNPNENQLIEALPSFDSTDGPKYERILTKDYLAKRLSETYV